MGPLSESRGGGCIRKPLLVSREHDLGQLKTITLESSFLFKEMAGDFPTCLWSRSNKTPISQYPSTEEDHILVWEWLGRHSLKGDPSGREGKMTPKTGRSGLAGPHWALQTGGTEGQDEQAADVTPASQPCPQVQQPQADGQRLEELLCAPGRRESALPAKPASHPAQLQGCGGREEGRISSVSVST